MNLDNLNKWLTLVANLGVIVGIIFLALEINQNTQMMQSQTRDAMTGKLMDWYMAIGTSEYASELFFDTSIEGVDYLGDDYSKSRGYRFMAMSNLRMWENEWYQYQKGLYEEEEFLTRSSVWPTVITQPGYRLLWEETKSTYVVDFRNYLDEILENHKPSN